MSIELSKCADNGTYRNCGMLWCLARHEVEYLLLDVVMGAMQWTAGTASAVLGAGRTGDLVLLLLGLLLAPLHRALVLRHNALRPHADGQALLQPALLALAPHVHVHLAGPPKLAAIVRILGHAAPKEALAALAGERVVMIAGGSVAADQAQLLLQPRRRALLALLRIAALVGGVAVEAARGREIIATCKAHARKIKYKFKLKELRIQNSISFYYFALFSRFP